MQAHEQNIRYVATLALLESMVNAASTLGIQGILRKLVVSRLPEEIWRGNMEIDETDAQYSGESASFLSSKLSGEHAVLFYRPLSRR